MFSHVLQQQPGTGQQQQRLNQPGRHHRGALSCPPGTFWGRSGKPHPALTSGDSDFTGPPAAGQAAAMLAAQPARFCSQHLGTLSGLVKHLMTSALMVSPESNDNSFKLLSKSDGILN